MKDANFYIYNVGHGVCTLLTGKKNDGTPYCGVFDCGTKAKNFFCETTAVIEDMKKKILDNAKGQEGIYIDDVVISHQDVDHWNKLLELFFSLNNIPQNKFGSYSGVVFGKKGEQAWRLSHIGSSLELCSVRESRYIKKLFTDAYSYFAQVQFEDGEIVCFDIHIYYSDDDLGDFDLHLDDEDDHYIVSLSTCKDDEIFIAKDKSISTSVESLLDIIEPYIDEESPDIENVLEYVASSFSEEALNRLDFEFKPENVNELKIPIKRVVMGGNEITRGYNRLKFLLFSMTACYSNSKDFTWERDGAYIIMNENMNNVLSGKADGNGFSLKKFPDYKIDLDPLFSLAVIRNLTSVIVQYSIDSDNVLIFPGDVTQHAFIEIAERANMTLGPGKLKLLLAPHHGSDNSNIVYEVNNKPSEWQPLSVLLDVLLAMPEEETASKCNLVISGYNRFNLHPGKEFMDLAVEKFSCGKNSHPYAYAITIIGKKGAGIMSSIQLMPTLVKRIYTTNCLPLYADHYYNNLYYKYCNGEIAVDRKRTNTKPDLKRRLPSNENFI